MQTHEHGFAVRASHLYYNSCQSTSQQPDSNKCNSCNRSDPRRYDQCESNDQRRYKDSDSHANDDGDQLYTDNSVRRRYTEDTEYSLGEEHTATSDTSEASDHCTEFSERSYRDDVSDKWYTEVSDKSYESDDGDCPYKNDGNDKPYKQNASDRWYKKDMSDRSCNEDDSDRHHKKRDCDEVDYTDYSVPCNKKEDGDHPRKKDNKNKQKRCNKCDYHKCECVEYYLSLRTKCGCVAARLTKEAIPATFSAVGDVITYLYTITNVGDVTINDSILIQDDRLGGQIIPHAFIPRGGSQTFFRTYTITPEDLVQQSIRNHATAYIQVKRSKWVFTPPAFATITSTVLPGGNV